VNGEDLYNKIKEESLALTFLPERLVNVFTIPISKNNKVLAALNMFCQFVDAMRQNNVKLYRC
jgi:hypothetical protein